MMCSIITPILQRFQPLLGRWRAFAATPPGARLAPWYAALLGGAAGALIADKLVRSMWQHAIFTGEYQWRTTALALAVIWVAIGVVAALALVGAPSDEADSQAKPMSPAQPEFPARPHPPAPSPNAGRGGA